MTIEQLQQFLDSKVILRLSDGEILTARINFVDVEYEDVIVDVVETSNPSKYRGPKNAVYTVKAGDVVSIEKVPG